MAFDFSQGAGVGRFACLSVGDGIGRSAGRPPQGRTGGACFDRVYDKAHLDKHPGQQTTAIRLSLQRDEDGSDAIIRVALSDRKRTNYIVGGCNWAAKANLDINDKPLIEAFKGPSGLNCYAMTSEDGSSAEEGGDFPIDLKDGRLDPALSAGLVSPPGRPLTVPAAPHSSSSARRTACSSWTSSDQASVPRDGQASCPGCCSDGATANTAVNTYMSLAWL